MASLISHLYRFMMRRVTIFRKPGGNIQDWRAQIDKTAFLDKIPTGATIVPVKANGVPAEWVVPAAARKQGAADQRAILYIHGGAWVICSPRTHRLMVSQLTRAAGIKALSIDYRLAPEHPFPAALEDCLAAYRWLLAQGIPAKNIAFAGDSAGGNLALAALLALRDSGEPLPAAAVCLSPATDLAGTGASVQTRAKVEVLLKGGKGGVDVTAMYAGRHDVREPLISPLYGDLHGLPPILIHVGDHEILLDDAIRFVERAREAGVAAQVVVWPEMWHVFQMHAPTMPEARQSLQQLGSFIREKVR